MTPNIGLIPTEELLSEILKRYESIIIYGALPRENEGSGRIYSWRYKGDKQVLTGLASHAAWMTNQNFAEDLEDLEPGEGL
jgi:hypothetical protein